MTALADTFDRGNSATSLGTASDGGTWTLVGGGTFGIAANKAYLPTFASGTLAGNYAAAVRDAGGPILDVAVTVNRPGFSAGVNGIVVIGHAPGGTPTGYLLVYNEDGTLLLRRYSGSSATTVASLGGSSWTSATFRVTRSAAGLFTVYKDGTSQGTATDTTYLSGTWVGFGSGGSSATVGGETWDDFTATGTAGAAVSGDVKSEYLLGGVLTVSTLTGHVTAENTLAGTLAIRQPLTSWATDDLERTDLPLELGGLLWVEPVEDLPPATDPYIQRVSVTMPTPTFVNGRPDDTWAPSVARSDWGRLQLIVNGYDLSRPRGKQFIPLSDAHTDPFGDAEARFAFPGLTEFDSHSAWHLTALAPVTLRRKDASGVFHTLYEGALASVEPSGSDGLVIECVGALYRMDLLKEPPRLLTDAHDYGDLIPWAFNRKIDRYALNVGRMRHVHTGQTGVRSADFQPFLTGTVQTYLSELQALGAQHTIRLTRPRTPELAARDTTTTHATVSFGAPGVDCQLSLDFTAATTAVYGSGTNGHCQWMGARFPNLTQQSAPAFPLTVGAVFAAGDGQSGFAPFAAFLRRGQYGTIVSDDTYVAADADNVEQFQDRAGVTVDGIVGAQTWEAAFQPGANQGSMDGAYVDTIYEKSATRKRLYNAQGADVGPNPTFDPTVPRIEDYIPFGDNVSKNVGRTSAQQIVSQAWPAAWTGTITLTTDPAEMSRFDLYAGQNIAVQNFGGSTLLLHVTRRERDWKEAGTVTLTVDEKARDWLTVAQIHQRRKDVADLTRRQQFGRTKSRVFNDYGAWLCEDGAGDIPLMNQQGGFWNVQRIAAAPKGTIERISLAMGSGLTEHMLNQAIAHNITSVSGAARGAVLIFNGPVTANAIANLTGMARPTTALGDGTSPVDHNQDALNAMGLIYAAGGPGASIGFYPNNDPGDGSGTNLTGMFEDGGSISFGPTGHYWLWVAIWTSTSCKVGGQMFPGPPG